MVPMKKRHVETQVSLEDLRRDLARHERKGYNDWLESANETNEFFEYCICDGSCIRSGYYELMPDGTKRVLQTSFGMS